MKGYSTIYEELLHLWKVISIIRFIPNAKNGWKRNRFFPASKRTNDSEVVGLRLPWPVHQERKKALLARKKAGQ